MTREVDVPVPSAKKPVESLAPAETSRSEVRGQRHLTSPASGGNPKSETRRSSPHLCPLAADIAGRPRGAPDTNADRVLAGPSSVAVPRGHHTRGELTILIGAW